MNTLPLICDNIIKKLFNDVYTWIIFVNYPVLMKSIVSEITQKSIVLVSLAVFNLFHFDSSSAENGNDNSKRSAH